MGPATLVGNLQGRDSLVTFSSFVDYRNSISSCGWPALRQLGYHAVSSTLRPFGRNRSSSVEVGYQDHACGTDSTSTAAGTTASTLNFIGYNIGLDVLFQNASFPEAVTGVDVFRYAANSINTVRTTGASIGANWYVGDNWMISGNYSWNRLVKTDEDDPIIPRSIPPNTSTTWG